MELLLARDSDPSVEAQQFEVVERKGIGHPDTICDALAEAFSAALSRWYLERFGFVAHHNVDKVLLRGGDAEPLFTAGQVTAPIEIYLAGRATTAYRGVAVPIDEIATNACEGWLQQHLHAIDPARHVRLHVITHPGSPDLVDLFMRQREAGTLLANDTSCGVGYWPLTPLEQTVLEVEHALNAPDLVRRYPEFGEDVKVMGIRTTSAVSLTVSRAMVGKHLGDLAAYESAVAKVRATATDVARRLSSVEPQVRVNAADSMQTGQVFLTVTGTSAEGGDDGQTGRGNRPNGLISTYRPMTMEAAAGKNPVTHVGKLYAIAANRIARRAVEESDTIVAADCALVSQIGKAVTDPQLVSLRVRQAGGAVVESARDYLREVVRGELDALATVYEDLIAGQIRVY